MGKRAQHSGAVPSAGPVPAAPADDSQTEQPRITLPHNMPWPPRGWPMFACVTQAEGKATRPAAAQGADNDYLTYEVTTSPDGVYCVEIMAGTVGRHGTSLSPVLGMRFAAREDWYDDNPDQAVIDLHVKGQSLLPEPAAVLRLILAMTFIISRIDRGLAPSLQRVLKLYRLA